MTAREFGITRGLGVWALVAACGLALCLWSSKPPPPSGQAAAVASARLEAAPAASPAETPPFVDEQEIGFVRFTMLKEGLPPGVERMTLFIKTPSGEVVERECTAGGSVYMLGKKGDEFTVEQVWFEGHPFPISGVAFGKR